MTPTDTVAEESAGRPGPGLSTKGTGWREPGAAPGRRRRWPVVDPVRLVCHLAAELPFVVLCLVQLGSGWHPTSDDALFSWRAWNVFSSHPTLLGAPTHGQGGGGHLVFAPGPLLSWLLAVPVHLDPLHGGLWGSALIGAIGAGVAVEAGRAAAGRWGMVFGAGAVLVVANTQVAVVLNPLWTPWVGAVWYLAALVAAWAAGCGRLGWWVVVVGSASLAAQAHLIYALPAVGLSLLSALLGWTLGRRARRGQNRRWIGLGLIGAAVLWLPTLVQQLADRPGNLTLLWRSARQPGGHLGLDLALRGLSSVTRLPPSWIHRLPEGGPSSFLRVGAITFGGSARWGGATVVLLVVVGTAATVSGRRTLAVAAWTAVTASVLTVVAVASVPASDEVEISYLNIAFVPVGIMAWLVMVAGVVEAGRSAVNAVRPGGSEGRISRDERHEHHRSPVMPGWAAGLGALVVLAASVIVVASISPLVPSDQSEFGGPTEVDTTITATRLVAESVGSSVPFQLDVLGGPSQGFALGVQWGTAYALFVNGQPVLLNKQLAPEVGQPPGSTVPSRARVAVVLDARGHVTAVRVRPPRHVNASPGATG